MCPYVVSFISLRHISVFGQCVDVCELSSKKHFVLMLTTCRVKQVCRTHDLAGVSTLL